MENHKSLIRPVRLLDGLKQAYWYISNSWQALISLLYRNLFVYKSRLRLCWRCLRSLISSYKQSRVNFLVFLPLPIMDFKVIKFYCLNIPYLYLGPLKQLCVASQIQLNKRVKVMFLRLVQQWLSARPRNIIGQALTLAFWGPSALLQRSQKIISLKSKLSSSPLYLLSSVYIFARFVSSLLTLSFSFI